MRTLLCLLTLLLGLALHAEPTLAAACAGAGSDTDGDGIEDVDCWILRCAGRATAVSSLLS